MENHSPAAQTRKDQRPTSFCQPGVLLMTTMGKMQKQPIVGMEQK